MLHTEYETTPLFSGIGAEAIVLVAHGLLQAQKSFPDRLKDYGTRLGPVVGWIDGTLYKAYDDAKVRRPNFDVIIQKLLELHDKHGVHGDIRLANLLSCGKIVDFDFVGATHYPDTLLSLSQDGRRHPDVEEWIKTGEQDQSKLVPHECHDWYSLGQVMRLLLQLTSRTKKNGDCIAAMLRKRKRSFPCNCPVRGVWHQSCGYYNPFTRGRAHTRKTLASQAEQASETRGGSLNLLQG
jgi:hypothetical protein